MRKPTNKKKQRTQQVDAGDIETLTALKKRVRDTQRLLQRDGLNAEVRVESERRLKALQTRIEALEVKKRDKKISKRYHFIRFIEVQKVERKLASLKKALEKADMAEEERQRLETEYEEARLQRIYVHIFPRNEKYVSLFPNKEETEEEAPVTTQVREKYLQLAKASRLSLEDIVKEKVERRKRKRAGLHDPMPTSKSQHTTFDRKNDVRAEDAVMEDDDDFFDRDESD